jgi:hypothetical protein
MRKAPLRCEDEVFVRYSLRDEAIELKGFNVMASAYAWQPNSKA